ncbi:MAG: cysteine--tRNA ligase [Elusimicrobiota bacterium]
MKIYNTLSRKIEEIKTLENGVVKIYTCGPTVYNYVHIGNLRTFIFEDFLEKTFKFLGYKVIRVMNITDVGHLTSDADEGEDKIEIGAQREGKNAWDIASFYTNAFIENMKELNCDIPKILPKATDHIKEMIDLIKKLEEKGYTYKTSDGIYYDTSKFKDYHKLMGESHIKGIKEGARIEFNKEKKNPTDFALWKFSPKDKKRQMEWDSPWGVGFPGWHIECSAMSMKYLGETLDIHCGGIDHIQVHHTNEIAQSEGATGKPFVNYWAHAEFLVLSQNEKMSKSTGNFITLKSLKDRGFSPLHYRYFCSQAHYRKQLEFSFEALESAKNGYNHLKNSIAELMEGANQNDIADCDKKSNYYIDFVEAISNDLNIPRTLAVVWEVIRDKKLKNIEKLSLIKKFDEVLSLDLLKKDEIIIPGDILELAKKRDEFKKTKDFKKADGIREILKQKGYIIEDTLKGPRIKKL